MPRTHAKTKGLEPDFASQFKSLVKTEAGKQMVLDAFFALSECIDEMVTEENTYITMGMSKNGTAITCTLHVGRMTYFAQGSDLQGLLSQIISL